MLRRSFGLLKVPLRGYLVELPCKFYLDDPLPLPEEHHGSHAHASEETVTNK
jgi:hypothetical protein